VPDGLRIDVIRAFGFDVLLLTSGQRTPARRDLHFCLGSASSPLKNVESSAFSVPLSSSSWADRVVVSAVG
jgi:hypothetical protein